MRLDDDLETPARIAERVANRRRSAGDDGLEALSLDPLGTVAYVCSHISGIDHRVLAEDVADALTLVRGLREELDRRELALMRLGRTKLHISWKTIADVLGLRSRQAAEQRKLRLEEALAADSHGRSEVAARARRLGQYTRPRLGRDSEPAWLARHAKAIESLAPLVAAGHFRSLGARDDAGELSEALEYPDVTPAHLLSVVSRILQHVEREREGAALPTAVLDQARRLVSDWDLLRPPA